VKDLEVHPLTAARWPDLETLFGSDGAYRGCWCMWWRVPAKEYERNKGEGNRDALKRLVKDGLVPGLLAYQEGRPVGWCSLGPREGYGRFPSMRSPIFKPVDGRPVWSLVCFFIDAGHRRQGVATELVKAAVRYAAEQGATVLEAYPREVAAVQKDTNKVYTGTPALFRAAGFQEVARRHPDWPVMRLELPG
jgi:GNAT superfamily N-acetyltransferase